MIRRKITTLGISACLIAASSGVSAADLTQVFQQSVKSDPTFQAAGAAWRANLQNLPISRSLLLPQILLSTATSLYNVQENQTKPLNRTLLIPGVTPAAAALTTGTFKYNSNGYTVNLSQVVFDYEAWSLYQQSKAVVKAADASYAASAQSLISRVARSYFSVLLAEDELRYIQAEKKAVYQQLDQVLQQYKVGLIAITGVYQAQAQYDRILAQEIEAKNNIINAKENLRAITGIFYDNLDGLKPKMPLISPNPNKASVWVAKGIEQNWTLTAARYNSEIAKAQISVEFSGHLPVVNLVGQQELSRTGSTPSGKIDNRVSSIGVQASLAVYQGGLVSAETQQAKYEYKEALDNQEGARRDVINNTHQSFNNITNGISKIKADRRAIVSGESSLRSTIEAYKVGTQTMLDVLQSQQDLFDTLRIYARDQYDYINATIALKEAAGTLTYRDLEEINRTLTDHNKTMSAVRTRALEKTPLDFTETQVPSKGALGNQGMSLNPLLDNGQSSQAATSKSKEKAKPVTN